MDSKEMYLRNRAAGQTAMQAIAYARQVQFAITQRLMLGIPEPTIVNRHGAEVLSEAWVHLNNEGVGMAFSLAGHIYELVLQDDTDSNGWEDDYGYRMAWETASTNEEQEGWGRDGRTNGRYVLERGRGTKVIVLPDDMHLGELIKYKKMGKAEQLRRAYECQDNYVAWAKREIEDGACRVFYTVKVDGEETDCVGGYEDYAYAAQEAVSSAIYTATH